MSPSVDYRNGGAPVIGGPTSVSLRELFGRPAASSFYDGTPGRRLVKCPDCRQPADATFRDHGGQCVTHRVTGALGIIYRHATRNGRFSANDVRDALDDQGIAPPSRGPAFGTAERRGYIEKDGYVESTHGPTKGHPVAVYRSLIYRGEAVA